MVDGDVRSREEKRGRLKKSPGWSILKQHFTPRYPCVTEYRIYSLNQPSGIGAWQWRKRVCVIMPRDRVTIHDTEISPFERPACSKSSLNLTDSSDFGRSEEKSLTVSN